MDFSCFNFIVKNYNNVYFFWMLKESAEISNQGVNKMAVKMKKTLLLSNLKKPYIYFNLKAAQKKINNYFK